MITRVTLNPKKREIMDAIEIKKQLLDKRWSIVDLARIIGVRREYLSRVIHGHRKGKRIWPKIAKALNIDLPKAA